jgi:pyridoxine kinase
MNTDMIKVATIAGSDASGGAGLEADLKTFAEYGLYGMTAITVIATMNPDNNWSHDVFPIKEEALKAQLETIFKGIGPVACKTGMLGTEYAVKLAGEYISKYHVENYVLDPVMVCKGAGEALHPELNTAVEKILLPLAKIITPNLFEAGQLAGTKEPTTVEEMKEVAKLLLEKGAKAVYMKGGNKLSDAGKTNLAIDIYCDKNGCVVLEEPLYQTNWTHGAGCTTAAAITAGLAQGLSTYDAVVLAKKFISQSLSGSFPLNKWVGPGNPSTWRKDRAIFGK